MIRHSTGPMFAFIIVRAENNGSHKKVEAKRSQIIIVCFDNSRYSDSTEILIALHAFA